MNADQLRQAMKQTPEPLTDKKPPYWEYWRLDLWRRVVTGNDPRYFGDWPCIYHTMLQNHWPKSIDYEMGQLDIGKFEQAIQTPHFGPDDSHNLATSRSMNLIHQAYHIQQWEQATGKRINQLDTIVEFGGGYGAMALLCHRLGFSGKYIIYDLPEFSLLQEYYLTQFGILDKVSWNPKRKPKGVDLFMALYSLSEVPMIERSDFVIPYAKSFLCLYSGQWEQWNNVEWFSEVLPKIAQYIKRWRHTELTHLPFLSNFYSIGW